ncbi:MAG: NHL repeat-containing protein [Planctomycetales bacterium]|nr:NHL repeat-containing protein [Planctomycetales bacterium]
MVRFNTMGNASRLPRLGHAQLYLSSLLLLGSMLPVAAFSQEPPAEPEYPLAVAADAARLYVADRKLPGVWQWSDNKLTLMFRAEKKFRTPLNAIRCLAIDGEGRLLAGDSSTRNVYRFEGGKPVKLIDGNEVGMPMAIGVASDGRIFVADIESQQIWSVPAMGGKPEVVAKVAAPRGLAVDAEDRIWVVSHGANQLVRLNKDGKEETVVEGKPFQFPHHIALDEQQNAYVADGYAKTIWKIAKGGKPTALVKGEPLENPVGVAWHDGTLWVADPRAKMVYRLTDEGKLEPVWK